MQLIEANTDKLISQAKDLFVEYAESLSFSLCFQNFDAELNSFPGQYSLPEGNLLLALYADKVIGCVGIRYFEKDISEMKRLNVKPDYRG